MPSATNKNYQSRSRSRYISLVVLGIWFLAIYVVFSNRQGIIDWWKLTNYTAPAEISQLATETTMNDYSRKVFYVNQPSIEDKTTFIDKCPSGITQEKTIVLGCYYTGQGGIFLLGVDEPRLEGVEQVTAAHEMLHAAYDRLNSEERAKIDSLLMDFYNNQLKDKRILDTIESYKVTEPDDIINEMHSIFPTEIKELTPELEQYYKKYFSNRVQIAGFAEKYQAEFTSRQNSVAQDDSRLKTLKSEIDQLEANLKLKQDALSAKQAFMNSLKSSGNITAYNSEVSVYNRLVNDYNDDLASLKALINTYNQLVVKRNATAQETQELTQELSTDQTPINN